jgi:signal transduction histidine kinase
MTLEPVQDAGRAPAARRREAERERWLCRLRLQRQLHDGASLRISALALQLGVVRHRVPDGDADLRASIDDLQDQLHTVLQELREVSRDIYPSLLAEAGLGPALRAAAEALDVCVGIVADDARFDPAVEGAAYFAVVRCLGPLDSGSPSPRVVLGRADDALVVVVTPVPVRHAAAMLEQVRGLGGEVATEGASEGGTIRVSIPCG